MQSQINGDKSKIHQLEESRQKERTGGNEIKSNGTSSSSSLVHSVQRKVQPSKLYHRKCGLPVGRNYGPPMNNRPRFPVARTKPSSGTWTCPPTFRVPGTPPRCNRKSLSMIDLSPGGRLGHREIGHPSLPRSESTATGSLRIGEIPNGTTTIMTTTDRCGDADSISSGGRRIDAWFDDESADVRLELDQLRSKDINRAASLVCHLLTVNAWRRRREQVMGLTETIQELEQQVNHLHLQIVVLRRLLSNENCRVETLGAEVHRVTSQLEDAERDRNVLKNDKNLLEEKLNRFRGESEAHAVTTENLRNELMMAKTQLKAVDNQISKDREKLLKLREDNKILLGKVSIAETLADERGVRADTAESKIVELEEKLAGETSLVLKLRQENHERGSELKAMETETVRLEKRLRLSEDAGRALSLRAANLEMQLTDREAALRRLESTYNSQLSELTELRERMLLQRQSYEGGWSSRVLQIAGSVAWAPRAILRSLSFLSSNGVR